MWVGCQMGIRHCKIRSGCRTGPRHPGTSGDARAEVARGNASILISLAAVISRCTFVASVDGYTACSGSNWAPKPDKTWLVGSPALLPKSNEVINHGSTRGPLLRPDQQD